VPFRRRGALIGFEFVQIIESVLGFRGDRNYLQGADIYEAVLDAVATVGMGNVCGSVSLILKKFAESQLDIAVCGGHDPDLPPVSPAGVFRIGLSEGFACGWLSVSSREVTTRFPYEEAAILDATRISGRVAKIENDPGYSAIEIAIAMTKQLHNVLYSAPTQRWIFSRLEIARPLTQSDVESMTIEVIHNLSDRLTKSLVATRQEQLGHIYFSLVAR
jgi:hypothetical protein